MKTFLLILFFSNTLILSDGSIAVRDRVEFTPKSPIEAITPGASIQIDVSKMISWNDSEDILQFRKRVQGMFPPGTIQAELIRENGRVVLLTYRGAHELSGDRLLLTLDAESGVPTGVVFEKVIVRTRVHLDNVKIYWKNYKK